MPPCTALRRAVSALAVSVFIFLIPAIMAAAPSSPADARAFLRTELVFPIQAEDAHGSTLVELPNGDLLVDWFQGSGERWAATSTRRVCAGVIQAGQSTSRATW